jgi:hypothetical protein
MTRQILYLHWKAVRLGLLPLVIAAFGLPLLTIQGLARPEGLTDGFYTEALLELMGSRLFFFPALAAIIGVTLALSSWSWDHETKHVYALSLPIARWRYAVLKFGAGALLALLPAVALLAGAVAASSSLSLPPLLHAYPVAVAVRFFFATLLVYAILFALAAGSIRTTVILLTAAIVALVGGNLVIDLVGSLAGRPDIAGFNFTDWLFERLTGWPGPFYILTGNWAFIDV